MLNTVKLFYILPDLAYIAELLPGKRPNDFSIQAFRQINGEFLDDDQFIANNVIKLFGKLEEGEYHLILPDFLFTNTIISVKESEETKIAEHLQDHLLPEIGINTTTHDIDTTVLTTFKNQSKVQISAIEKAILAPLRVGVSQSKTKILSVSPLSWTVKSLVSLEPSITVLQIGSMLYSALHYIGIDQTNQASTQDTEKIAETIKTLKGAESNVQTLYLLTNSLVESRLKESLSQILPLQQLTINDSSSEQLPSYVKQIIETGAKTLAIADYPVPKFQLAKATLEDEELSQKPLEKEPEEDEIKNYSATSLVSIVSTTKPKKIELKSAAVDTTENDQLSSLKSQKQTLPKETAQAEPPQEQPTVVKDSAMENTMPENPSSPVIKNQTGVKGLIKMLLITLSVFVAVVAVGVGVGLGLLSLSNNKQTNSAQTPAVEVAPTTPPESTPTPTPEQTKADLSSLELLVVNATTKAGYAGKIKTALETAGAKSVTAGNAKGTYQSEVDGLVLMPEENNTIVQALSQGSGLTLEYGEGFKAEDSGQGYSAVVVLLK